MAFDATSFIEDVPKKFSDIENRPDSKSWLKARDRELNSIFENETWEPVEIPKKENIIDTKRFNNGSGSVKLHPPKGVSSCTTPSVKSEKKKSEAAGKKFFVRKKADTAIQPSSLMPVQPSPLMAVVSKQKAIYSESYNGNLDKQGVTPEATNIRNEYISSHLGIQTFSYLDSVEIKTEGICDVFEERVHQSTPCVPEVVNENQPDGVCIKEEYGEEEPESSSASAVSSTTTIPGNRRKLPVAQEQTSYCSCSKNTASPRHSFSALETIIQEFIEIDRAVEVADVNILSTNMDAIDMCIQHLIDYRSLLTQSLVKTCKKNREATCTLHSCRYTDERSFVAQSTQTGILDDGRLIKKRKIAIEKQSDKLPKLDDRSLKIEDPQTPHIFTFPNTNETIMALERVQNQLLMATEEGNIIFASLHNGMLTSVDVTHRPITSMTFVKGLNDFIYMFVGSMEEVLRVYDFKRRIVLKACRVDDEIRCMDSMWDFVFMGCKGGTIIRYSCKIGEIETQEKIANKDILVLKAAQEGPRRVLIIGYQRASIFIRDAFSGLCLRNFSNETIVPTVYSIVIQNSFLYCGTLEDNILVFAFHEGHLLEKIAAGDSKGISCMKIYRNYLFAGCHSGSVYVYNLNRNELVMTLRGPGGGILCMEILSNQVIVGTVTSRLQSLTLPINIFEW